MREAVLHLAFDGLGAKEATSDAFVDNHGCNAISRDLGYEPNGSDWRRGGANPPCSSGRDSPETTGNSDAETTSSSTTSRPVTPSCPCPDAIRRLVAPPRVCPELVRILRHHMDTYPYGPDGRLFVTRTGTQRHPVSGGYAGPVSGSSYGNTWRKARAAALTTAEVASPLARRPYHLRQSLRVSLAQRWRAFHPGRRAGRAQRRCPAQGSTPSASPGRRTALSSAWT